MKLRNTTRRGVTLTEVLVALFVMALGMLALLTLFPLGAMQIGQALKDDRTAQSALEADAYMRTYWEHEVVQKWNNGNADPVVWAMDDPNLLIQQPTNVPPYKLSTYLNGGLRRPTGITIPQAKPMNISPTTLIADKYENPPPSGLTTVSDPQFYVTPGSRTNMVASYPVMIDPLGTFMSGRSGTAEQYWLAGNQSTNSRLPRRGLSIMPTQLDAFRHFSLTDDIWFESNGAPDATAGLRRQGRYNWAVMLQRPDNADPLTADMKVLVFDGRLPFIAPANEEVMIAVPPATLPSPPPTAAPNYDAVRGQRQLTVVLPQRGDDEAPILRVGGWIMDGTVTDGNNLRADFYRIVSYTWDEDYPGTIAYLDLDKPLKHKGNAANPAQFYFFAGLAEVFDRPALTPTNAN